MLSSSPLVSYLAGPCASKRVRRTPPSWPWRRMIGAHGKLHVTTARGSWIIMSTNPSEGQVQVVAVLREGGDLIAWGEIRICDDIVTAQSENFMKLFSQAKIRTARNVFTKNKDGTILDFVHAYNIQNDFNQIPHVVGSNIEHSPGGESFECCKHVTN